MGFKSAAVAAVRAALSKRELEIRRTGGFRLHLYDPEDAEARPYYNIGAGSFFHPFWTNVDFVSEWYAGVQKGVLHHDLTSLKPLPIETATAKVIYTSHTIEHVTEEAVRVLFSEAFRCLRGGGYFRVTTGPDADTDYAALMRADEDWFYWSKGHDPAVCINPPDSVPIEERWLHHVASQLAPNDRSPSERKYDASAIRDLLHRMSKEEALDFFTSQCEFQPLRPGNHITWWNHAKVERFMREAGFTDVYRSGYQQSRSATMRQSLLFDTTHPQMSVYVEAVR